MPRLPGRSAVQWTQQHEGAPHMSLKGTLAELPLTDLIEITSLGQKTGRLDLFDGADQAAGTLFFENGRLVGAYRGALTGEQAFYAILTLRDGSFALDPEAPVEADGTLDASTASLLIEGMRRVDEVGRLRKQMPAPARLSLRRGDGDDETERLVLAHLGPGARRIGDIVYGIVLAGVTGEYEVLCACERLLKRGVVEMALTPPPDDA
jgi:hypothetical protein